MFTKKMIIAASAVVFLAGMGASSAKAGLLSGALNMAKGILGL